LSSVLSTCFCCLCVCVLCVLCCVCVFLAPESGSSGAAWAANARVLEKWAAAEARLAMRRWDVPVYFARETPAVRAMFEWRRGDCWCLFGF
jgi:hypothetical protein